MIKEVDFIVDEPALRVEESPYLSEAFKIHSGLDRLTIKSVNAWRNKFPHNHRTFIHIDVDSQLPSLVPTGYHLNCQGYCFFKPDFDEIDGITIRLNPNLLTPTFNQGNEDELQILRTVLHELSEGELWRAELSKSSDKQRPRANVFTEGYQFAWHEQDADEIALSILSEVCGKQLRYYDSDRTIIEIAPVTQSLCTEEVLPRIPPNEAIFKPLPVCPVILPRLPNWP